MLYRVIHSVVCRMAICAMGLVALVRCSAPNNVILYQDVNLSEWSEAVKMVFPCDDGFKGDLSILLHINHSFSADTAGFEIIVITPDSLRHAERIAMPITVEWDNDKNGVTDIVIPYRRDVEFAQQGDYTITIEPLTSLVGVEAVGVNFQRK